MDKILIYLKTMINGLWSNIPICCCHFFSKRKSNGEDDIRLNVTNERGFETYLEGNGFGYLDNPNKQESIDRQKTIEYVECDNCFLKQRPPNKLRLNGVIFRV